MKEANKRKLLEIASYILDFPCTLDIRAGIDEDVYGKENEGKITIYIMPHIELIALNNIEDEVEQGALLLDTLAHEARHAMQEKWNKALPQAHPEVYNKGGVFHKKEYAEDEGEIDAREYAKKCVEFWKMRDKKVLKMFARYMNFYFMLYVKNMTETYRLMQERKERENRRRDVLSEIMNRHPHHNKHSNNN